METTDKAKQLHCLELQLSASKCLRAGLGQWWHCVDPRLCFHTAPSLISLPVCCGFSNKLPSLETNCGRNCSVSEDTTSPGEKISLLSYRSFLNASSHVTSCLMGLCRPGASGSAAPRLVMFPSCLFVRAVPKELLAQGVQKCALCPFLSTCEARKSVWQSTGKKKQRVGRVGCILRLQLPAKLLQMRPGRAYQSVSNLKGGCAVLLVKFSTVLPSQTPFLDT